MSALATASPEAIDTELADLYYQSARADAFVASWIEDVRYATGERPTGLDSRRNKLWAKTADQAESTARALVAENHDGRCERVLAQLDEARTRANVINAAIALREDEYQRRGGWTRFFLVNNNGGHIHSSTSCTTCYITTQFGWLPKLSGLTEADAVAEHGTILCSVCFPLVKKEWTQGKPKPPRCAGSGRAAKDGTRTEHGMRVYGDCPECGVRGQLTPTRAVRAHRPAA